MKDLFKRWCKPPGLPSQWGLLLTILAGLILVWPLHNFQFYLSQGDHGRDLYCFQQVLKGALPYRDFSWLFGPLMPYYYSLFYLVGGITIQSVLLGQGLLIFFTGIVLYRTCAVFLPPLLSFLCAFWYWSYRGTEFFYTYNHSGGLLALLFTLYCLFKYIRDGKQNQLYAGFFSIFLLCLIRLNMGIAILVAYIFSLLLTDFVQKEYRTVSRWKLHLGLTAAVLASTFLIYWFLLSPLPDYAFQQSFPYAKSQRTDYTPSVGAAIYYAAGLVRSYFTATAAQKIFGVFLLLSLAQTVMSLLSPKTPKNIRVRYFLLFASLAAFLVLSSHEFIASGVYYRTLWIYPLIYLLLFFLIGFATRGLASRWIKLLVFVTLFLPPFWTARHVLRVIHSHKVPLQAIAVGKNKIYTTQNPLWIAGMTAAVQYIRAHVPLSDTILVLPLDPLYLFLAERSSATRQLVFFEHINIPPEQEIATIRDMERNRGNWVLLSSRMNSPEEGLGTFGKDYCPLLSRYIEEHFEQVAQFGDWEHLPGWAWNHGVKILKRIQ